MVGNHIVLIVGQKMILQEVIKMNIPAMKYYDTKVYKNYKNNIKILEDTVEIRHGFVGDYVSLLIIDNTPIKWIDRFIKGCKVGMILLNTNNPQCIVGYTKDRSITLNNSNALDKSFDITEKNFTQIFNIYDLEKLYEILNEGI